LQSFLLSTNIVGITIDSSQNIYVVDAHNKTIYQFNSEGRLTRQFGREGRGLGDFERINSIELFDTQLYAFDNNQHRITIFDVSNGEVINTINVPPIDDILPTRMIFLTENNSIVEYRPSFNRYNLIENRYVESSLISIRAK